MTDGKIDPTRPTSWLDVIPELGAPQGTETNDASLLPTVHSSLLAARTQIDNAIAVVEGAMGYQSPAPYWKPKLEAFDEMLAALKEAQPHLWPEASSVALSRVRTQVHEAVIKAERLS